MMGGMSRRNMSNVSSDGALEDLNQIHLEYGFDRYRKQCRLKTTAFEIVKRDQIALQQGRVSRRPVFIEKARWDQAERRANQLSEQLKLQSHEKVVPIAVVGFRELRDRIRQQDIHVDEIISHVGRLNTKVQMLKVQRSKIKEEIKSRLNDQIVLCHRLMHMMEQIAVLKGRDLPLTPQEIQFRDDVEAYHVQLNSPRQFKAKLAEIVQLERMKQTKMNSRALTAQHIDYRNTFAALEKQTQGLDLLTRHLKEDTETIRVILRGDAR